MIVCIFQEIFSNILRPATNFFSLVLRFQYFFSLNLTCFFSPILVQRGVSLGQDRKGLVSLGQNHSRLVSLGQYQKGLVSLGQNLGDFVSLGQVSFGWPKQS